MNIAWDINKDNTKKIIDKIKQEDSEEERTRFNNLIEQFKRKFDYTDGVATSQTILKIKHNLEEDYLIAERRNDKHKTETIKQQLDTLKLLEIIK